MTIDLPISDDDEVTVYRPSFYTKGDLVLINSDPAALAPIFNYVLTEDDQFHLDGTANRIFDANEAAGLRIDAGNAGEYLKFFCASLIGEEGRYSIITEPSVIEETAGGFRIQTMMRYGGDKFIVEFFVERDGVTAMTNGEQIGTIN